MSPAYPETRSYGYESPTQENEMELRAPARSGQPGSRPVIITAGQETGRSIPVRRPELPAANGASDAGDIQRGGAALAPSPIFPAVLRQPNPLYRLLGW